MLVIQRSGHPGSTCRSVSIVNSLDPLDLSECGVQDDGVHIRSGGKRDGLQSFDFRAREKTRGARELQGLADLTPADVSGHSEGGDIGSTSGSACRTKLIVRPFCWLLIERTDGRRNG